MKLVVIVRGLPGSGKSTFVRKAFPKGHVASADHFFIGADGVYRFEAEKLSEAHASCRTNALLSMMGGVETVVVDNTHVSRSEFAWIAPLAARFGYNVTEATLFDSGLTDAELAARNTHGVSEVAIAAMRARWEA